MLDLLSSNRIRRSENTGEHVDKSDKDILIDHLWHQELQSFYFSTSPWGHLHHEAFDTFKDELSPFHAPLNGHLFTHLVSK